MRLDFLLGFAAGWIVTTEEGRKMARDIISNVSNVVNDSNNSNDKEIDSVEKESTSPVG